MSFIIRSRDGQRTVTTAGRSNRSSSESVRDELVEALRGLTVKFELRVSDILFDEAANSGEKRPTSISEEILAAIKEQVRARDHDRSTEESSKEQERLREQERLKELERLKEQERIREQAQEQIRTRTLSNIRPVVATKPAAPRPETAPAKPEVKFTEPKKVDVEPPAKSPTKYTAGELLEIKDKMAGDNVSSAPKVTSQRPAKNLGIISGRLKIGSVMRTGCIWVDESGKPFITYDNDRLTSVTNMISNIDVSSQPQVSSVDVGDIVFAQSKDDDSWYRAVVEDKSSAGVTVYMFDWGLRETVDLKRVRRLSVLELGMAKNPATAIKIKISNPAGPLVDKFLECEEVFDIKVESYDDSSESYSINILGPSE